MPQTTPTEEAALNIRVIGSGRSVNDGSGYRAHTHPNAEVVAVLDGRYCCEVDGQRHDLARDELLYLPAGQAHEILPGSPWETRYLIFDAPGYRMPADAVAHRGDTSMLLRLLALIDECHGDIRRPETLTAHLVQGLVVVLRSQWRQSEGPLGRHPGLQRAMAVLRRQPESLFDARLLARQAGLSVSHLNKLFRREVGCSPLQYQTDLRMSKARRLLSDPYLSISEVARQCGWEDRNYFIRRFRALHGLSPRQWSLRRRGE